MPLLKSIFHNRPRCRPLHFQPNIWQWSAQHALFLSKAYVSHQTFNWFPVELLIDNGELTGHGASLNIINQGFLQPAWKQSVKSIKSQLFRAMNSEGVNTEVTVTSFICTDDLLVFTKYGIVRTLAVALLLGTLLMDGCKCRVYAT